jgi:hypothetical protein
MNATDLAVGLGAAVVGFGIIWGVFALIRQQRAPPVEMFNIEPKSSVDSRGRVNLAELGATWHVILGVHAGATSDEIEAAYHARLAECDRIRFSSSESAGEKQNAEVRRAQVNEAYEFIRSIKH